MCVGQTKQSKGNHWHHVTWLKNVLGGPYTTCDTDIACVGWISDTAVNMWRNNDNGMRCCLNQCDIADMRCVSTDQMHDTINRGVNNWECVNAWSAKMCHCLRWVQAMMAPSKPTGVVNFGREREWGKKRCVAPHVTAVNTCVKYHVTYLSLLWLWQTLEMSNRPLSMSLEIGVECPVVEGHDRCW